MQVETSEAIGHCDTVRPPQAADPVASCSSFLSPASQSSIEAWIAQAEVAKRTDPAPTRKRKRFSSPPASTGTDNTPERTCESPSTTAVLYAMSAYQLPGPATPSRTPSSHDPFTPSTPSKRSFKIPSDAGWVSRRMEMHGMVSSNRKTLNRFPSFKSTVESILQTDRSSAMKPASVQKFVDRHEYMRTLNEDSILVNLIPLLIKDQYLRKLDPGSEAYRMLKAEKVARETGSNKEGSQDEDEDVLISRDWFLEGIMFTCNTEFRRTLLPNAYENDPEFEPLLSKALAKGDGMKNSKPDYCYGLQIGKLDPSQSPDVILDNTINYLTQVAPGMEHPFFIIEGKSNKGSVDEAENQARRGGATLVNAGRELLGLTSDKADLAVEGADVRTFVFSATMTPQCMDIYVHWAEVIHTPQAQAQTQAETPTRTRTLFHMTFLKGFHLRDQEDLPQLRAILHNILQWGCSDRLADLQTIRRHLDEYQRNENVRLKEEARRKATVEVKDKVGRGKKRLRREDEDGS